jgi:GT2 family glycosyltransferase
MVDLSIVIVNRNAGRYLGDCLRSLFENSPHVSWEVIVVDNASTDGSQEMVRQEFPAVKLVANSSNLGFAAACNLGARSSSSRYILFLNPDTLVHPRTLTSAVKFMEDHREAAIMGCRTIGGDGRIQPTAFDFPAPFRMFGLFSGLNRFLKITRLKDLSRIRRPDYVQGSFFFIRREIFEKAGGFDENFFMYAEDVDLCLRIRHSAGKVFYIPHMTITHYGSGSAVDSLKSLESYIQSLILLYVKHRSSRDLRRLRRAMWLGLFFREFLWAGQTILKLRPLKRDALRTYRNLLSLSKSGKQVHARPSINKRPTKKDGS